MYVRRLHHLLNQLLLASRSGGDGLHSHPRTISLIPALRCRSSVMPGGAA